MFPTNLPGLGTSPVKGSPHDGQSLIDWTTEQQPIRWLDRLNSRHSSYPSWQQHVTAEGGQQGATTGCVQWQNPNSTKVGTLSPLCALQQATRGNPKPGHLSPPSPAGWSLARGEFGGGHWWQNWAMQIGPLDPASQAPRATPTPLEHPNITDIRYDEDYLRFYQ
eukprot:881432-Pelagomonas_calceolata.AAC.5